MERGMGQDKRGGNSVRLYFLEDKEIGEEGEADDERLVEGGE